MHIRNRETCRVNGLLVERGPHSLHKVIGLARPHANKRCGGWVGASAWPPALQPSMLLRVLA